jgi:hypothetical protein
MLIGFALRVYRLDVQSLWYDEGVTADVAQRSLMELTRWTANDIQPPLYYYLVAGWGRLAGWSEWSLRFPSVGFGLLLIPLLALYVRHLTTQPGAPLLAALITALHPLLLYYSQEARMYTLLTALGVAGAYCVLQLAAGSAQRRFWVCYILAATAAVYTHYFAFFLWLALGVAFLVEQWRRAPSLSIALRHSRAFVAANGIVLLLYLPWLRVLWTRLAADASYWQGDFKVGEALRHIAISFTSGVTVREGQASWLLLPFGGITLLALFGLLRGFERPLALEASPKNRATNIGCSLVYALCWLIIPIVGVLTLASLAPKFNTRYVLLALPGLLILWGAGLSGLLHLPPHQTPATQAAPARPRTVSLFPHLSYTAIAFFVLTSLQANYNWFFDLAFTKDQWRQVTEFLRPRLQPQEQIILVSGHAWPVWRYYAADLPVVRLPEIDVLDVNAMLTFANTAAPLRAAFVKETNQNGAWLVQWQEEVVDPGEITPVQLELGGREKGQSATFWGITLRRFSRIRPQRIVDAPPISQPLSIHFGDQLLLLGYHVLETGDLLLFWQRPSLAQPAEVDYQFSGETLDASGQPIAQIAGRRPGAYHYPIHRWGADEVVMGQLEASQWLGPNPTAGRYLLRLTVYTLITGQVQLLASDTGQTTVEIPITVEGFD